MPRGGFANLASVQMLDVIVRRSTVALLFTRHSEPDRKVALLELTQPPKICPPNQSSSPATFATSKRWNNALSFQQTRVAENSS